MIRRLGVFRWLVPVSACAALAVPLTATVMQTATIPVLAAAARAGASTLAARGADGEPYDYVALGDSYSSGEGNPPFDSGTANGKTGDTCHRSARAWPRLMAAGDPHLHLLGLLACSGAKTPDVYESRFKTEQVQIAHLKSLHPQRGTIVTITIGGNDVGFAPTFTDCYEHDCYTDGKLARAVSAIRHQLPGELARTFKAIAGAVPAGSRVVVGYPNIVTPSHRSRGRHCRLWLTTREEDGLVAAAALMDKTEKAAASAAGLGYVSTLHVLAGHELCTGHSWVKSVNVLSAASAQTRQEFGHPLLAGQKAIAAAVEGYFKAGYLHYGGGTVHAAGKAGSLLSASASVSGGTTPVTAYVGTDGSAPSWLSLSVSGRKVTISGTPPRAGAWAFDIEMEDARQWVVTIPVTLTATGSWSAAEAPLPANAASARYGTNLQAIACPSASACVAGGDYQDSAGAQQALLLTESGATWRPTEVKLPAGAAASPAAIISSVACPAATRCVGAGWYTDSTGQQQALLVTGWGTSWTASRAPVPSGGVGGSLASVACSSASSCTAVGYYDRSSSSQAPISQALMVTGSGMSWKAAQAPLPGAAKSSLPSALASVACSAVTCAATGDYNWQAQYDSPGLLLRRSGSSWTPTTAPMPAGYQASPADLSIPAVACASSTCVAAGWYQDVAGNFHGVLLTDTGQGWIDARAPLPGNAGTDGIDTQGESVACPSAISCVVDGSYGSSAGLSEGVILTGLGSSWSAAQIPLPAQTDPHYGGTLGPLACASASRCTALGSYISSAYFIRNLAVTGWGTGWAATGTPFPANADANAADDPYTVISAVACPSSTRCVAVGSYTDSSGAGQGLLLTGGG